MNTSKELHFYVLLSDRSSLLLLMVQSCENKVTLVNVTVSEGRRMGGSGVNTDTNVWIYRVF